MFVKGLMSGLVCGGREDKLGGSDGQMEDKSGGGLDVGLESWSKTLGVVRGLTTFKRMGKRRKMAETREKQFLWKKLAFRLKIFNILSTKYSKREKEKCALRKLKKRLGR